MDEDFTTAMRSGARQLADQTNLTPARLIRTHGDQRRRRRSAGAAGLLLISGTAIGAGIVHFSGPGPRGSVSTTASPTTTSPTTAIPTPTIPTPSQTSSPEGAPASTNPKVAESPTAKSTPTTTTTTSLPQCKTAQLKITYGQISTGLGNMAQPLLFLNTSSTACQLHGYPKVTVLDAHGHPIAQARQTPEGYMGGLVSGGTTPPTIDLAPGLSASAIMEAIPSSAAGPQCPAYNSILVTPPNETHPISLSWTLDRCTYLEVHPLVPGSTGRTG